MFAKIFSWIISFVQMLSSFFCPVQAPDDGKIDVTFDFMNGTPAYSIRVEPDSLLEEPVSPENRGLIFNGWYLDKTKWDFEKDTVTEALTLKAKWKFSETFFDEKEDAHIKTDGANLRIMSFNILASDWNNNPAVKGRDELAVDVITRYQPDVIGMQEVNAEWYASLNENFGTYKLVNADNNKIGKHVNYSTIAYNTETVRLVEYSQKAFAVNYNKNCRNLMWAVFESISEPSKRFIVTSTHWDLTSERRVAQAVEMSLLLHFIELKYHLPIFCTGDFNSRENLEEYSTFTKLTKYESAKYSSEKKGLVSATSHLGDGTGSADDYQSGYWKLGKVSFRQKEINTPYSIDHIFVYPGTRVLYYDTIVDEAALEASDHCPIYADIMI